MFEKNLKIGYKHKINTDTIELQSKAKTTITNSLNMRDVLCESKNRFTREDNQRDGWIVLKKTSD